MKRGILLVPLILALFFTGCDLTGSGTGGILTENPVPVQDALNNVNETTNRQKGTCYLFVVY